MNCEPRSQPSARKRRLRWEPRQTPNGSTCCRPRCRGCDRVTRLVEQLLTLAGLESGAEPALTAVDLVALARQVVADAAPLALNKQQAIEIDASGPCAVPGDVTLLSVMMRNLVDNAIRYSPSGASVKLAISSAHGAIRLSLDDSGPGMSPADMQRIGEFFFRVVGSGQDGSGLGWSITRRIAAIQRAVLRVGRSVSLGGLSVEVEFPADGAS